MYLLISWAIPGLFFFIFDLNVQLVGKVLLMSGFELPISGVGSNLSTN